MVLTYSDDKVLHTTLLRNFKDKAITEEMLSLYYTYTVYIYTRKPLNMRTFLIKASK